MRRCLCPPSVGGLFVDWCKAGPGSNYNQHCPSAEVRKLDALDPHPKH